LKQNKARDPNGKLESPPARGRGLKHLIFRGLRGFGKSPPARGRGLKQPDNLHSIW